MASEEAKQLAIEIFNTDPQIVHLGLIDLKGNVLLDQSSAASAPIEPDPDRIQFYNQLDVRQVPENILMKPTGKLTISILLEKKCSK